MTQLFNLSLRLPAVKNESQPADTIVRNNAEKRKQIQAPASLVAEFARIPIV
jgi:hypothetical protein